MSRNKKAFLLAVAFYLPLLLGLWQAQKHRLFLPQPATNDAGTIPFHYLQREELPASIMQPPQDTIYPSSQPKAPKAADAAAKKPTRSEVSPKEAPDDPPPQTDPFAPAPLSGEELSEAFEKSLKPSNTPQPAAMQPPTIADSEMEALYGELIHDLSAEEKAFIEDRLEGIGRITQRYLRYPDLAGRLRMSGEVVLAFMLLPGGDITPIEVQKSSGYSLLDDNAVRTVEIAHKDYPHPDEPVRIRLRVIYRLY
jgi:TonB family protein